MTSDRIISKQTTIEQIVNQYPELIRPLMQYGIKCVVCGEPIWGTLQENAEEKGIENLENIIEEMNGIVKSEHGQPEEQIKNNKENSDGHNIHMKI